MPNEKIAAIAYMAQQLGCKCAADEPLSAYTTFKIGGRCELMVFINSHESLSQLVKSANAVGVKYMVLGNGSNVLFSDDGYSGVIFLMGHDFSDISVSDNKITASAGAMLSKVCRTALDSSLCGMEFAWGIPGTVGGAVYMNAGAYGGEMKDIVAAVTCLTPSGDIVTYQKDELDFGYRHSRFKESGEIVLSAEYNLAKGDYDEIKSKMDELMNRRKSRQPLEYPSAGSAFKRPEGTFAGLVIEESGLKGYKVGGAQISQKHANFIINLGGATACDVLTLVSDVKRIVKEKTGFSLECEIEFVD